MFLRQWTTFLKQNSSKFNINSVFRKSLSTHDIKQNLQPCERFKFAHVNRSLIQLEGSDCCDFLQGLITNDIRHLMNDGQTGVSRNCIYAFMLNSSGKVLADCFVYSLPGQNDVLLMDIDSNLCSKIVALLKRYKIRRDVIIRVNPNYEVHAIFPEGYNVQLSNYRFQYASDDVILVQDPRNHNFGYRMIRKKDEEPLGSKMIAELFTKHNQIINTSFYQASIDDYDLFRYHTGYGEGSKDFLPESLFPFEANAEILNSVSFHKGCYVGQELTARTYHTGVVRKRLMPIKIHIAYDQGLEVFPVQNVVHSRTNKIIGRFRCNRGNVGLAILKYSEIFTNQNLKSELMLLSNAQVQLQAIRPIWWPENLFCLKNL